MIGPHAISVDVEDWLNATVLQQTGRILPPGEAVVRNSERLLDLFAETGTRATWFFLGEIAERFPTLVRGVALAGHEVGIHGYHHQQLRRFKRAEYREAVWRAKSVTESAAGAEVAGHRAVDFGVNGESAWVFDELLDAGFKYDASIFPARTPRYGTGNAPVSAHWTTAPSGRHILEIPVSVCSILGLRIPFAGGGYFRLLPFAASRLLATLAARRGPLVYYLHPCEIETAGSLGPLPDGLSATEVARVSAAFRRQRIGRSRGLSKYRRLLSLRKFAPIAEVFRIRETGTPLSVDHGA